jgi:hypothetical protein
MIILAVMISTTGTGERGAGQTNQTRRAYPCTKLMPMIVGHANLIGITMTT